MYTFACNIVKGDIVYQDIDGSISEFENFHVKGEWKISKRGNSGIIYLIHENTEQYPYCWMTGLEMQVLDNGTDSTEGHPYAAIYKHRAGDLYDINAAPEGAAKLAGEWNQFEIVVQDGRLTQILNGIVTVDRQLMTKHGARMLPVQNFMNSPDTVPIRKTELPFTTTVITCGNATLKSKP